MGNVDYIALPIQVDGSEADAESPRNEMQMLRDNKRHPRPGLRTSGIVCD